MKLQSLNIRHCDYGAKKGTYTAQIKVGDDSSSVEMEVGEEDLSAIISAAMDGLVRAVDRSGAELRERLLLAFAPVKALPSPEPK